MRPILAMVAKDIRLLARDRMGFFFTFVFPLVMAVFFGTIFSGGGGESRGIRIAIVDEDRTDGSRAFVRQLHGAPEFTADSMGRAEAVEAVRLGRRSAFVAIPPGFGAARQRMFHGRGPELELGLDPSRRAEAGMLQGVLAKYMTERLQEMFSQPQRMRDQVREGLAAMDTARGMPAVQRTSTQRFLGELDRFMATRQADSAAAIGAAPGDTVRWRPVTLRTTEIARTRRGPRNAYEVSFPQGVIWAILSTAFGFALSLVTERSRGTLVRLRMAPLPGHHILIGKALGCLLTILAVSGVLLLIGALVFKVHPSSPALLAMAVGSAALGFVGIMMAISVMGSSQHGVSGLGWAVMMMMSMTGGGMVPLFAMPAWMQSVSVVSPVRWAIVAIEGAIWRGFTPAQMLLPCAVLLGIGVVGFAIGARVFRWTEAS